MNFKFGGADLWATKTDSMYKTNSNYYNGKQCRYCLNLELNDNLLSKNARIILESAYIPSIIGYYVNVRIVTSTQDTVVDTIKYNSGTLFYLLLNEIHL